MKTIVHYMKMTGATALFALFLLFASGAKAQNCQVVFTYQVSNTQVSFLAISNFLQGSYSWDFGDGATSTLAHLVHTYSQPGIYYVCLTATVPTTTGSCTSFWCDSVIVGVSPPPPPCNANFTWHPCNNAGTTANTICFTPLNPVSSGTYSWDFGDGHSSTMMNAVHLYQQTGTYFVCLTVTQANPTGVTCTAIWCDSVIVGSPPPPPPPCIANFTWHPCNTSGAVTGSICFMSAPNTMFTSYLWDFGDGHTSANPNPVHTYQQAGTYYVCLTVTQATSTGIICTATWCDSVTTGTNPPPPPPIPCNATFTTTNCNNPATASGTVCFHSAPNNPGTNYLWDFGDGHSSALAYPVHSYTQPGSYLVCLTVTYQGTNVSAACTATWCDTIVVGSAPPPPVSCNPNFTSHPCNSTASGANTVCFTSAPNPSGTVYNWNFGDGNSSGLANPVHTYAQPGNYMVCLTVSVPGTTGTIACTATWCHPVIALNAPNILFANPFTYTQKITIDNADIPLDFDLFDIRGQKIFSQSGLENGVHSLPANNLNAGIYFYQFKENGKVISSGKVIIK